ncbi:hypothetical protein ES708_12511 [subsurface metagenome]
MKITHIIILSALSMHTAFSQTIQHAKYFDFPPSPTENGVTFQARDYIDFNPGTTINGSQNLGFEINQGLIFPVDYLGEDDIIDPETRELNTDLPIGTIQGISGVSNTGAATYSVPIQIPPGTEGMEPAIGINYNSQTGNGILGIGWNIGGISMITRTGSTRFHDNEVKEIRFNDEDRFILNGQRLEAVSGTYGNSDAIYHTEIESFSEITPHGSIGDGPAYFKVRTKDGRTYYYGDQPEARMVPSGSTVVLTWFLTRVEDRQGNYIAYNYKEKSDGETYLTSIEYTGNDNVGMEPFNKILFVYEERTDVNDNYLSGKKLSSTLLLSSVKTYAEESLAKEYKFNYFFDEYSYLNTIEEYDSEGNYFNSTVVGRGEVYSDFNEYNINNLTDADGYNIFFGDFNGDGRKDILKALRYYDEGAGYYKYTGWELYTSTGNYLSLRSSDTFFPERGGILIGDINGDGVDEVITKEYQRTGNHQTDYKVYEVNQTSFDLDWNRTFYYNLMGSNEYFGDINGDGINEMFAKFSDEIPTSIWKNEVLSLSYFKIKDFSNSGEFDDYNVELEPFTETRTYLFDFTGDGRMNPVFVTNNEYNKTFLVVGYDEQGEPDLVYTSGYPTIWHNTYFGDFNGDRVTDILSYYDDPSVSWSLHYGTGTEWKLYLHFHYCHN